MAEFVNPFPGRLPDRKLSKSELIRALRQNLAAELEAIHLYTAVAEATNNAIARERLENIADEERVHAGEFLRLIEMFTGDEGKFLLDGALEVDAATRTVLDKIRIDPPEAGISSGFNPLDPLGLTEPVRKDLYRLNEVVTKMLPETMPYSTIGK